MLPAFAKSRFVLSRIDGRGWGEDRVAHGTPLPSRLTQGSFPKNPLSGKVPQVEQNDEKKQVVWEAYFDVSLDPMVNNKGVYQTAYEYNEQGKITREAYYDANGEPMANKSGYIVVERAYNKDGKKISETGYTGETDE